MKTWKTFVQINGENYTAFIEQDTPVSEDVYKKIEDAIQKNIPISKLDCAAEIISAAECAVDLHELVQYNYDYPKRNRYDEEKDYIEACEKYEKKKQEDYYVEDINIYDPGDLVRLNNYFVGKVFKEKASATEYDEWFTYTEEYDVVSRIVEYSLYITFDENGTITRIHDLEAKGFEGDSVKETFYSPCYPNYDYLRKQIEDELNEC